MASDLRTWPRGELVAELRRLRAKRPETPVDPPGAVSHRTVAGLLEALDAEVGSDRVDALLGAAQIDARSLRKGRTGGWIPWAEHERVLDAFEPLGAEIARRVGAGTLDSRFLRFLPLSVRALPSMELVLRWCLRVSTGPGGLVFRGCGGAVRRLAPDLLELRFSPPSGGRVPRFWLELVAGGTEQLTRFFGASDPRITVSRKGRDAVFMLRFDEPPSRVRSILSWRPIRIGSVIEDARSELRQRNEELQRRISELEASERERTELEEELQQRQQMEAIGRLAGGVAHDFNNLLTAMLGQIEALEHTTLSAPQEADVREMRGAAERATELARRLLVIGRRQPLEIERISLDETVERWALLVASAVGEPMKVRLTLDARGVAVNVDPAQLERVLVELALDVGEAAGNEGELVIATSIVESDEAIARHHPDATSGPFACITVACTGPSAEPAKRARDRRERSAREWRATGMGINAAYSLAQTLGGGLSTRTASGGSKSIELYLPIVESAR